MCGDEIFIYATSSLFLQKSNNLQNKCQVLQRHWEMNKFVQLVILRQHSAVWMTCLLVEQKNACHAFKEKHTGQSPIKMKDELLYQAAAAVVSFASDVLRRWSPVLCICSLFLSILFKYVFLSLAVWFKTALFKPQHIFRKMLHNTRLLAT